MPQPADRDIGAEFRRWLRRPVPDGAVPVPARTRMSRGRGRRGPASRSWPAAGRSLDARTVTPLPSPHSSSRSDRPIPPCRRGRTITGNVRNLGLRSTATRAWQRAQIAHRPVVGAMRSRARACRSSAPSAAPERDLSVVALRADLVGLSSVRLRPVLLERELAAHRGADRASQRDDVDPETGLARVPPHGRRRTRGCRRRSRPRVIGMLSRADLIAAYNRTVRS